MYLYLVRHASAFDPDPTTWPDDRGRPLTSDGEKKFGRAARGVAVLAASVDVVLASPLTRAWQTAEILHTQAGWPEPLRLESLEPGATAIDTAHSLQPYAAADAVALVGHEPGLRELASFLLSGESQSVRLSMKKGSFACLSVRDGFRGASASLEWLLQPRILRSLGA